MWQGWATDGNSDACQASAGYSGPCASELFVGELTSEDKAKIEVRYHEASDMILNPMQKLVQACVLEGVASAGHAVAMGQRTAAQTSKRLR